MKVLGSQRVSCFFPESQNKLRYNSHIIYPLLTSFAQSVRESIVRKTPGNNFLYRPYARLINKSFVAMTLPRVKNPAGCGQIVPHVLSGRVVANCRDFWPSFLDLFTFGLDSRFKPKFVGNFQQEAMSSTAGKVGKHFRTFKKYFSVTLMINFHWLNIQIFSIFFRNSCWKLRNIIIILKNCL